MGVFGAASQGLTWPPGRAAERAKSGAESGAKSGAESGAECGCKRGSRCVTQVRLAPEPRRAAAPDARPGPARRWAGPLWPGRGGGHRPSPRGALPPRTASKPLPAQAPRAARPRGTGFCSSSGPSCPSRAGQSLPWPGLERAERPSMGPHPGMLTQTPLTPLCRNAAARRARAQSAGGRLRPKRKRNALTEANEKGFDRSEARVGRGAGGQPWLRPKRKRNARHSFTPGPGGRSRRPGCRTALTCAGRVPPAIGGRPPGRLLSPRGPCCPRGQRQTYPTTAGRPGPRDTLVAGAKR